MYLRPISEAIYLHMQQDRLSPFCFPCNGCTNLRLLVEVRAYNLGVGRGSLASFHANFRAGLISGFDRLLWVYGISESVGTAAIDFP